MGSVGKVAAFSALIQVFMIALPRRIDDRRTAILVLALLTLVVGSVLAVVQTDVKRMLAYSSISHAGFFLVGLETDAHIGHSDSYLGISSAMGYLFIYSVLVFGTFKGVAKFGIIRAAVSFESHALAVVAMLAAVIAAFLYLRIMVIMRLSDPADDTPVPISRSAGLAITLAVAVTLYICIQPSSLLGATNQVFSFIFAESTLIRGK